MTFKALLALILIFPTSCFAVLGEQVSSEMRASTVHMRSQKGASISVHQRVEHSLPINEYYGADGVVYAITWHGRMNPNLETLLGKYLSEYKVAAVTSTHRIARRALSASSANLEIRQFGHPGALNGMIVLKNKLPPGVSMGDLQ